MFDDSALRVPDPFRCDLEAVLGHFRGSKWVPNRLRRGFKNDVENDAPKIAQIGPQEPSKAPQVGPQIGPKSAPDPHIFFRDPLRNRLGPPGCSGPPPGPRRDPSGTPPGPLRDPSGTPPGPSRTPPGPPWDLLGDPSHGPPTESSCTFRPDASSGVQWSF